MHDFIKLFKRNVPRQKKLYQEYMVDCKIHGFSYEKFKSTNVALIEIKDYLESLDEYYYLSKTQIDNMFTYLRQNINIDKFAKLKKVFKQLNDLSNFLSDRYNMPSNLHGKDSRDNCLYIINKIDELRINLSKRCGKNVSEIEKIILFENVVGQLLNPKEFVFDEKKLLYVIDNMDFICFYDRNNGDFNYNFCKQIEKAKINRDKKRLNYFKSIYLYLSTVKQIYLDDEYLNYLFDINVSEVDERIIYKKIDSMRIHPKTGNRMVEDYILSIDNDTTKKIDDAFSIEKIDNCYLLGIHIADVYSLGYFEEDSLDVNQKSVDKGKASLAKNKVRNAVSMYLLIDNNGIIRNYKMLNTTLITDVNLIYDDIPKLLKNNDVNPHLKDTVINLISVYNLLENSRFPSTPTINNLAYVITSKLMVLCCSLYSEEFYNRDIPAIYLCGDCKDNFYSLEKSNYYTGFKDHDSYARVTSPIIDRLSLINQFFIHRFVLKNRYMEEDKKDEMILRLTPVINKLNNTKDNKGDLHY